MRVVVAGATGFVGRALVAALKARGDQPLALSRDASRAASALGVEALSWAEAAAWRAAVADADAVVNLAGEGVAAARWTPAYRARLRESRIEPARALAAAKPRIFLQASGVGYYGDRGDASLTEADPPGDDFMARLAADWEAAAGEAAHAGARVAFVRLGMALGRGGGALDGFLKPPMLPFSPFRLGLGGPFGNGRQWVPWIHLDDVVGLFLLALADERVAGPLNAVAPEAVTGAAFARALGKALGKPAFLPVPAAALRLLLGDFAGELLKSQKVIPARAQALGYGFRFSSLDAALRGLV